MDTAGLKRYGYLPKDEPVWDNVIETVSGKVFCKNRFGCVYGQCPWNLFGVDEGLTAPKGYEAERMKRGWAIIPANKYEVADCRLYTRL